MTEEKLKTLEDLEGIEAYKPRKIDGKESEVHIKFDGRIMEEGTFINIKRLKQELIVKRIKMFEKHRDIETKKGNKNMALVNTCLIIEFKEVFNITKEDLK